RANPHYTLNCEEPLIESEVPRFVYAQTASRRVLEESEERESAPIVLQERIQPKTDVRVTVIGDQVFAASTQVSEDQVDWR
ncbi:MAG: hypothetical protein LH630_10705, partial [Actinomycetia bacterium]|nr:hypothetical protein [Actinomycetes bacterium]